MTEPHLSQFAHTLAEAMKAESAAMARGLRSIATGHRGMQDWLREDLDGEMARLEAERNDQTAQLERAFEANSNEANGVIAQLQTMLGVQRAAFDKAMEDVKTRHDAAVSAVQVRHQAISERLGMLAGTLHVAADETEAGITPQLPELAPKAPVLPIEKEAPPQTTEDLYLALT